MPYRCPIAGSEVEIVTHFLLEEGGSCAVSTTDLDYACSGQETCPAYWKGDQTCLLFQPNRYAIER